MLFMLSQTFRISSIERGEGGRVFSAVLGGGEGGAVVFAEGGGGEGKTGEPGEGGDVGESEWMEG